MKSDHLKAVWPHPYSSHTSLAWNLPHSNACVLNNQHFSLFLLPHANISFYDGFCILKRTNTLLGCILNLISPYQAKTLQTQLRKPQLYAANMRLLVPLLSFYFRGKMVPARPTVNNTLKSEQIRSSYTVS